MPSIIALAGNGGDTEGVFGGGPSGIFGGPTASIVRIEDGCPVTVASGLPSGNYREADWVWGVMDIAFLDGQLYALVGGGGEDFGNPMVPNGVYRVDDDGSTTLVANLSSWLGDFPPKYGRARLQLRRLALRHGGRGRRAVGQRGGRRSSPEGDARRRHHARRRPVRGPSGADRRRAGARWRRLRGVRDGQPRGTDGSSLVVHVAEDGTVSDVWTGLTAVTDVVLGPDGALYAAEMATGNTPDETGIHPGTGRVVRQNGMDGLDVVASGLDFPAYLGFAPDGSLYVGSPAIGADAR